MKSKVFQDDTIKVFLKGLDDNDEEMEIGFINILFEMYKIRQEITQMKANPFNRNDF